MASGRWLIGVLIAGLLAAGCEYLVPAADDRPAGGLECLGVVASKCSDLLNESRSRGPVAAMRIRCTSATCTEAQGEVEITVWRPDGSVELSGAAWTSPIEAPPIGGGDTGAEPTPPVLPMCVAVPIDWCHRLASQVPSDLELARADEVMSISVRCTKVCDAMRGEGGTVTVLRDGRRHETDWAYEGAAP